MSTDDALNRERMLLMARQHAESLRSAGVEWVPRGEPLAVAATLHDDKVTSEAQPSGSVTLSPGHSVTLSGVALGTSAGLFEGEPAEPSRSPEEKRLALAVLDQQQVVGCTKCAELARSRTQTVFGVGNPAAELCFVGEAPGADEDARGEPFVGAAGQLLTRIIAAMKMTRKEVYICNILKCRPPGNRTPLPNEVANCLPYLEQQLAIIRPRFICALGAVAAQTLLQTTVSIGKLRSRFHNFRGIPVLCTYHPAFLLRSPDKKKEVWEDMKLLLKQMGRPVP